MPISPTQSTQTHFWHDETTTATADRVWQIWTDVEKWPTWDLPLKSASLEGPFSNGVKGTIVPKTGSKAGFVIRDVTLGQTYTLVTPIPLGALHIKRQLSTESGKTLFRHEVWFSGPLKGLFGLILGKGFRKVLPEVMALIKKQAESA
jgi:hypothetical protein